MNKKELTIVWMNNGTENGHQAVKKDPEMFRTGHNISSSSVTNGLHVLRGRKKRITSLHNCPMEQAGP